MKVEVGQIWKDAYQEIFIVLEIRQQTDMSCSVITYDLSFNEIMYDVIWKGEDTLLYDVKNK